MALTFKRQPARKMLIVRDLTTQEAADFIGCTKAHLGNALRGRAHPSNLVRERLPLLIGLPLEALFDEATLAGEYTMPRGRRASK